MSGNDKIVSGADAVLNDVIPILTASYEAFERGVFEGRDYFDRKEKAIDPHLFAHIARYSALEVLKGKGLDLNNAGIVPEWRLKSLQNSGIYIAYRQYRVRVLKFKREVPHPGHSLSRMRYYEHNREQMQFDWPLLDDSQNYLNLLLLWKANDDYSLGPFSLACPEGAGTTRDSVELRWIRVVPLEYLQNILIALPSEPPTPPEDLPIEENVEVEIDREFEE